MNFKRIFVFLFLLFSSYFFAETKWNIVVANWIDLSDYRDKSIASMLKSSVYNKLIKEKNFDVQLSADNIAIFSITEANNISLSNKADIIVYGYYYVEGKSIFVITEVWDVLKKKLKMRSEAKGVVGIDIFDTIDEISLDIKQKIKEVLPELTLEEETEVKKLRQTIYEKEEIKVERQFYTKFGVGVDFGVKNATMYYNDGMGNTLSKSLNANYPVFYPMIGFMIRYWDIRTDFFGGPMPGWLVYNSKEGGFTTVSPVHYMNFSISYYLPFFNKQFALGLTVKLLNFPDRLESYDNKLILEGEDLLPTLPFGFNIIWNPNKTFEFSLSIIPFVSQYKEENKSSGIIDFKRVKYYVPFISLSGAYFINRDIGVELEMAYASYDLFNGSIENSQEKLRSESRSSIMNFIISFIYRVDYSELSKNAK
ncbi:MAG: hypothetical protein N2258_07325 [Brevinematales bacterium]|nr:hypothetical protein [Brevinematales bacterium]